MAEHGIFHCGHSREIKPNLFGRGKAREQRIARYFARLCKDCFEAKQVTFYRSLTKNLKGEKFTEEEVVEKVQASMKKAYSSYLCTIN